MFGCSKTLNKLLGQLLDVHKMNSERLDLMLMEKFETAVELGESKE